MLISASIIKKPRKSRKCDECGKPMTGPTLRLYGAGSSFDPPYAMYLHPECTMWEHPKIIKVKNELAGKKFEKYRE